MNLLLLGDQTTGLLYVFQSDIELLKSFQFQFIKYRIDEAFI